MPTKRLRVIATIVFAVGLAGSGCQGASSGDASPAAFAAQVTTIDGVFAVVQHGSRLDIVELVDGNPRAFSGAEGDPGTAGVHLVTYDGDTGRDENSFVFGFAPNGSTTFELGGLAKATITNGAYLVVLPEKDLHPLDLHWSFLDNSGRILTTGDGVT